MICACAERAFSAAALWELQDEATAPPVVVGEHTLQLGRGEGSGPALDRPLGPGVELRVVTERGGWYEVRLPDGHGGWLPANVVERI